LKTVICLPDVHLTDKVPKEYLIVKKFIKDYKPDEIVLLGDFMDISSLSYWNKDKRRKMERSRYKKEIDTANKELDYLEKYTKKITYLEGNHENWVEQYIDRNPEMEGILEIPKVLELKNRKIRWYKYNSLYQIGHLFFTHGCYTNEHHAKRMLQAYGCNIVYCHSHRWNSSQMIMKMQKPLIAYGLGCLCNHEPDYLKGRPAAWVNQFAVVEFDDNWYFNLYPVTIIHNRFTFNKKTYKEIKIDTIKRIVGKVK